MTEWEKETFKYYCNNICKLCPEDNRVVCSNTPCRIDIMDFIKQEIKRAVIEMQKLCEESAGCGFMYTVKKVLSSRGIDFELFGDSE
jgi:hypothetical protein